MTYVQKYRPAALEGLAGQPAAVRFLSALVDYLRESHGSAAVVLHGPPGTGKTTAAWAIARRLGCDVEQAELGGTVEIASGQQDGRAVVDLAAALRLRPMCGSGWRVAIVNEADAMTRQAELVWLDVLENLPPRVVVIFTTNSLEGMSERFQSRCQVVEFRADSPAAATGLVLSILAAEGVPAPPEGAQFGLYGGRVNYRLAVQQAHRFALTGEIPASQGGVTLTSKPLTPAQKAWVTRRARQKTART
jgi:DNA polymerase III delta prime subunit